jgi:hypothetical protein
MLMPRKLKPHFTFDVGGVHPIIILVAKKTSRGTSSPATTAVAVFKVAERAGVSIASAASAGPGSNARAVY